MLSIAATGPIEHLGLEPHPFRGFLLDRILQNQFLLLEVIDLRLELVDIHGRSLISGPWV